ncbi:MAG TPA: carbohydrate kinase [Pyrinomonadaceae bacterium]|jgi:fructokinase
MKTAADKLVDAREPIVVGLGELIWDMLPGGKQLGGAPTNFAYISRLLGHPSIVASRVGADALGREARERLRRMGLNTDYLQLDESHPTGTVGVRVDERGEAHFQMNECSAWDFLEWTGEWEELALRTDAVCFGTLGQRERRAREIIIRFLERTRPDALRIFDVNLRHTFFTTEMLQRSLELATMVKLNQEELNTVACMLQLGELDEEALSRQLIERFSIALVAITRGENGSVLITKEDATAHPGFRVKVVDTIGAGDAFTAALAHFYLRGAGLETISEAANRMGSWVATQTGATPELSLKNLEEIFGGLASHAEQAQGSVAPPPGDDGRHQQ